MFIWQLSNSSSRLHLILHVRSLHTFNNESFSPNDITLRFLLKRLIRNNYITKVIKDISFRSLHLHCPQESGNRSLDHWRLIVKFWSPKKKFQKVIYWFESIFENSILFWIYKDVLPVNTADSLLYLKINKDVIVNPFVYKYGLNKTRMLYLMSAQWAN